ncbi:Clan CA, family C19, ubiquitin hydrolase-like cysteine peptidase [Trichomonas vaginalis G3]|uniref:Clan CA, family C19, ubiquitin hydrolase-like cysteine peptidase n=1 Tax=Trichomonas vaginalis (strain ATCC PRA-98 / G3) TaxID=412133 RepID=A2F4H8_TRIV3|nr:ubiquitinyl hydrolase protein [Trichomonas vaginalis G3]EAY00187.1 Clan CA, family C19, ubiquitin hydrolase-like cysteine peptidase [Trichomonas vaginalis G3]KAI5536139.1 ubiquitinyl hydrolase protein [Trichomonas vaginalis G3]|eukprot:XP_001313116.1 Clan CA, family C19, ubiquitin hydrolase-like cysteine peptidase [Trichomonas vaginalis G3]
MSNGSFIDSDKFNGSINHQDPQVVASILSELTQCIHQQNISTKPKDSKGFEQFINEDLPDYWDSIISLNSPSRILQKELQNFYTELYTFIAKLNLPVKYLEMLNESLKGYKAPLAKLSPINISKEKRAELLKFDLRSTSESFIKDKLPNISQLGIHQINELIGTPFLSKVLQMIKDRTLSSQQLTELIKTFNQIQPFLNPIYAVIILQMLADCIIQILPIDTTPASIACPFLSSNAKSMVEKTDEILHALTSIDISLNVQTEFFIVDCICKFVQFNGLHNSALDVKKELIRAAKSKNTALISLVIKNLTIISERTPFDLSDITELLSASTKYDGNEHLVSITHLLPLVKEQLDNFAMEYLSTGKLYPPLDCALIDRTKKDKLRAELFDHATSNITVLQSIDFSTIKQCRYVWKQLLNACQMNISIEKFITLSCFLLANPNCEAMPVYLKKAIQIARMNPAIITSLLQFSKVIKNIDISSVYNTLLDEALASVGTSDNNVTSGLFSLLSTWTECYEYLKPEEVIDKLKTVNFIQFPLQIPHFIDVITSRLEDKNYVVPLLMSFLKSTIPEIHSHWLVHSLFKLILNDDKIMDEFVDTLINNFSENRSRNAAVLMDAVCLEADFFRIDDEFGLVQTVTFTSDSKSTITKQLSFHPFHSSRRIYFAAGKAINCEVSNLALLYNDGYDDIMFRFNTPLTSFHLGSKPIIEFRAERIKENIDLSYIMGAPYDEVQKCHFLNRLTQKIPELFSQINGFDIIAQRIFLILMLFEPFTDLPRCSHPLQHVFTNTVRDATNLTQATRIFPYVLRAAARSAKSISKEFLKQVVDNLTDDTLDAVSLSIACQVLPFFNVTEVFSSNEIKKFLLDCNKVLVRKAIIPLISDQTPVEAFVSLLPLTTKPEYRAKTFEFFEAMSKFDYPKDVLVEIYKDLTQFEISHYLDVDQTFICLCKRLPRTDELVQLTIKRLFSPPTCTNLNAPFVHTQEAFSAGLEFIRTTKSVQILLERLRTVPNCPRQHMELSDDFTYKGRCGINNLGSTCYASAIIQTLSTIPTLVSDILKLSNEQLNTPFLINLRSLLAQNVYARGSILNVKGMMEDRNGFDPYMQEDAGEFLNTVLNSINDTVSGGENIMKLLTGSESEGFYTTDGQLISKRDRTFTQLQLVTEKMTNLYESFEKNFQEEVMHDYKINEVTGERADVIRRAQITKWPDYLALTLSRYEFDLKSATYTKLTHEFDFPMVLQGNMLEKTTKSNPGCNYNLTAVILHTGTTENGHYTALVEGEDKEWYVCDDESVDYFSQAQIPSWSFGGIENVDEKGRIMTAYLLLYRRNDYTSIYPEIPHDLEPTIDETNASAWSSIIFYSPSFVDFIRKLLLENQNSVQVLELAVMVLFKVTVPDPKRLELFAHEMSEVILQSESRCETFCELIDNRVGDSLQSLLCYSDFSFKYLGPLMISAVERITSNTRPIYRLLKLVSFSPTKRCAALAHDFITTALKKCVNVDWTNEDELLLLMAQNIVQDTPKESQKPSSYMTYNAVSAISQVLLEVSEVKISEAMLKLFEPSSLAQIVSVARRCETFIELLTVVAAQDQEMLEDLKDSSKSNKEIQLLLVSVAANSASIGEEIPRANFDFIWHSIFDLIFHDTKDVRQNIMNAAMKLLKTPDQRAIDFLKMSLLDENLTAPPFYDGSSLVYYFAGLTPIIYNRLKASKNAKQENTNFEAISLVIHASLFSPSSIVPFFSQVNEVLENCQSPKVIQGLATLCHHVIVFDRKMQDKLSEKAIQKIFSLEKPGEEVMQLLKLYKNLAEGTPVLSAAVSFALSQKTTPIGSMIADIVSEVKVANYAVPVEANGMENIKLCVALLQQEKNRTRRSAVLDYLLSALTFAKPIHLFKNTKTVSKAIEILKDERHEKLSTILSV